MKQGPVPITTTTIIINRIYTISTDPMPITMGVILVTQIQTTMGETESLVERAPVAPNDQIGGLRLGWVSYGRVCVDGRMLLFFLL